MVAFACFMVLLVALVVVQVAVEKLTEQNDKEVAMNNSMVPVVPALLETGWAIGASFAANAVSA